MSTPDVEGGAGLPRRSGLCSLPRWHVEFRQHHGAYCEANLVRAIEGERVALEYLQLAEITKRFTVHGLRYTFTDLVRRANVDAVVRRALTGHVTEQMQRAGVRFVVRRQPLTSDDWADPYVIDDAVFGMVDLGVVLDRGHVVVRIGDEAAAAGMRLHDEVIAADGMLPGASLNAAFAAVPPGRELRWTVKRGGSTLALHARAPWLGSAP